ALHSLSHARPDQRRFAHAAPPQQRVVGRKPARKTFRFSSSMSRMRSMPLSSDISTRFPQGRFCHKCAYVENLCLTRFSGHTEAEIFHAEESNDRGSRG